jgi:thiamine transport system substrate-binding protein
MNHPTRRSDPPRTRRAPVPVGAVGALLALALVASACGSSSSTAGPSTAGRSTTSASSAGRSTSGTGATIGGRVRLLTDDSFAVSKPVLAAFEARTGIKVEVVKAGDGVEVVNKAVLTKSDPEGDVLYGIDNNTLTTAYQNKLFTPYRAAGLDAVPAADQLDPQHRVTPVDQADVCVDYDAAWFRAHHVAPPASLADLTKPAYKSMLVTEDPATSTPGLAFLLATIAAKGTSGTDDWQSYWKALRANGVEVADSWDSAFYTAFSGGGAKGTKPIVVSYATDPAYAVLNASPQPTTSPIGVINATCYRQVEFAGVLSGARHPAQARALVDFLLSLPFQQDMPLQMYVQPVNAQAKVPARFARYTARPASILHLPPAQVGANRSSWVDQWTAVVIH